MSFGNNEVACHRNYPIPGPGGPSPMVAPFWDDVEADRYPDIVRMVRMDIVDQRRGPHQKRSRRGVNGLACRSAGIRCD